MTLCPIARITRVLDCVRVVVDEHAFSCGDRVLGFCVSPQTLRELSIVEIWGLPVLASAEVRGGVVRVLCEAKEILVPPVDTAEELIERWTYHLGQPAPGPLAA